MLEFYRGALRRGIFAALLGLATGCGSPTGDTAGQKGASGHLGDTINEHVLRRGLPGEPQTLDPQLADDTYSFQIARDLYEGLTSEDRNGKVVPGVASSWTVDETGTVYTFQIRPNARWSDGKRVDASEFVEGLRRAVDPHTATGSAALLAVIKGATEIIAGRRRLSDLRVLALDDSTIRIELEHPAPFILQVLSQPIGAPLYTPDRNSRNSAQGAEQKPTNGPYVLAKHVPNSYIELKSNPYYWDFKNVAISDVRYVNVESEATELKEYIAGQLDMTSTIPASELETISREYGTEVQIAPILGTFYLALNMSESPLKNDVGLRQALSMAVDREEIARRILMVVTPAYSFVPKGISGYIPSEYDWAKWPRDRQLTVAKALFARSGYSPDHRLKLRLYFNRDEGIKRVMIAIAASWKQNLGIDSELLSDEFRVFLAGRKDRTQWDVARLAWNADYDDPASFLDVFAHGNTENDPGYESGAFNELINKARMEANWGNRIASLRESEHVLLGDYPIIPVYFYTARRLVKPYIGGARITPLNHTYSKHLFWKLGS